LREGRTASGLLFLIFLLLVSCSSKPQGGQEKTPPPSPEAALQQQSTAVYVIRPENATRDTALFAITSDTDLSRTQIQWMVNGQPVQGQTGPQFKPGELRKGDIVQAKVGAGDKAVLLSAVTIKNSPPVISSATLLPAVPKTFDALTVEATATDRDDDKVTLVYDWYRNDQPAGKKATLEGPFKAGDRIMLKLTPFDGEEYGPTVVLIAPINNSPPVVTNKDKGRVQGNIYSYRITASDPDGDPLIYKLRKAPAGMTIEESTGLITWRFTAKDTGRHPVSVQISDGKGGEVLYDFDVNVGFEK
jgi:hypothetical protein